MPDRCCVLDLDEVAADRVERLDDGTRWAHLAIAVEAARACPACGVFACRVKGTAVTRPVVLHARPNARDELLRLTLKSNSEVERTDDGGLVIRLYVDRWEWLIPLVTSYGGDVLIEEPAELRDAVVVHLRRALGAGLLSARG